MINYDDIHHGTSVDLTQQKQIDACMSLEIDNRALVFHKTKAMSSDIINLFLLAALPD